LSSRESQGIHFVWSEMMFFYFISETSLCGNGILTFEKSVMWSSLKTDLTLPPSNKIRGHNTKKWGVGWEMKFHTTNLSILRFFTHSFGVNTSQIIIHTNGTQIIQFTKSPRSAYIFMFHNHECP